MTTIGLSLSVLASAGIIFYLGWRFRADQGAKPKSPPPPDHGGREYVLWRMDDAIDSWKDKADTNCRIDTASHRLLQVVAVFQPLAAALALQLPSKGVVLPLWLVAGLTVAVLVVAGVGQYVTEMGRKHDYAGRWPRIRQALDGLIADRDFFRVGGGPFASLGEGLAEDLAVRRVNAWVARARGMAPQAPIPEK